jgi:predicted N-acetyltransferase YhbS
VTVEIRPATAADSPGIRRLFAKVFGVEMTSEEWEWKFVRNPDGWFGMIAVAQGQVVGNFAGWGMRFRLAGEEKLLYSVGDLATDPSVRSLGGSRGIYRRMADAFYEAAFARGVPFCFGFPNPRSLEISHHVVGTRTLFPIREVHLPCEAFPVSSSTAGAGDFVGETFDTLWREASRHLSWAAVRDRARANWRFHARPTHYYRMVWRESGGQMQSWAVLSVLGEKAILADYLSRRPDGSDLPDLFAIAAAEAAEMGAKTLVFWDTPGGPGSARLACLPGERRDAGFPLIVRVRDEDLCARFAEQVALTPAMYDII